MRTILLIVGAACLSTPAMADEADFSGVYAGINGGYGKQSVCWNVRGTVMNPVSPIPEGCQNPDGLMLGGQIGYNLKLEKHLLMGIELQGDWTDANATGPSGVFPSDLRDEVTGVGIVSARLGVVQDRSLFFAKLGVAAARTSYRFTNRLDPTIFGTARETRWGPAAGAGFELATSSRVSVGFEYTHLFLGTRDNLRFSFVPILGDRPIGKLEQSADLALFRINYRFGH